MDRVLLDIWLVLALCLTSGFAAGITERPFELIVHRDPDTLKCTHLALRETQHFRGLTDSGYFKSKRLETGEERVQFIAEEEQAVWERAESLCGEKHTWDFHTLIRTTSQALETDQVVLRPVQDNVPQLEISPLITSGDSSNRVDLVFFADGCKIIFPIFVLFESLNMHIPHDLQIRQKRRTNSSTTPFALPKTSPATRHSIPSNLFSTSGPHSRPARRYDTPYRLQPPTQRFPGYRVGLVSVASPRSKSNPTVPRVPRLTSYNMTVPSLGSTATVRSSVVCTTASRRWLVKPATL